MGIWVWAWIYLLFLIEAALVPAAFALRGRFQAAERRLAKLARHRAAPLFAGVLAVVLRLAVLPVEPLPAPGVHDEFSYLLAADTFLHGRLANPTHPLWPHFETMQEEQQPTYASMYPPAQGLMLAAGILLTGAAFTGVLLSVGAMCASLCWALAGWFTPGWALLGAVLAAVRLGMFSYWADSYWGGALAAAGGALVFGALPRLARRGRVRDGALAGLGIVILLNTRPYEGAVFVAAAGVAWLVLRKAAGRRIARLAPKQKTLAPAPLPLPKLIFALGPILLLAAVLMGYYNWRVFGNALTMPYRVNRDTYATAQIFLWQAPRVPPPLYRHLAMRDFYMGFELEHFLRARTLAGYLWIMLAKAGTFWSFYFGPLFTLPLVAAAWTLRSRRTRVFLWLLGSAAVAGAVTPWFAPHYAAPVAAVLWALLIQGMRVLSAWRPGAVRSIALLCAVMVAVRIAMALAPVPFVLNYPMTWATTWTMPLAREEIVDRLKQAGGRHLVIVHYDAGHDPLREYVFNAADIDAADVVWARDMGPDQNREIIHYFASRKVWLLEGDRKPPDLMPYPAAR
jgi:hypothetical protein